MRHVQASLFGGETEVTLEDAPQITDDEWVARFIVRFLEDWPFDEPRELAGHDLVKRRSAYSSPEEAAELELADLAAMSEADGEPE